MKQGIKGFIPNRRAHFLLKKIRGKGLFLFCPERGYTLQGMLNPLKPGGFGFFGFGGGGSMSIVTLIYFCDLIVIVRETSRKKTKIKKTCSTSIN